MVWINSIGVVQPAGSKVDLWRYVNGLNQQWKPESLGGGYYRFVSRASNRCLDVPGAQGTNGLQLQIWDCNGSTAQAFRLSPR